MPFFRNNMCGDLLLVSPLHLVDNAGQVVFDPLFKIRPFITLIMEKFLMFILLKGILALTKQYVHGNVNYDSEYITLNQQSLE